MTRTQRKRSVRASTMRSDERVVRFVGREAMEVELRLHRPVAAAELARDVRARPATNVCSCSNSWPVSHDLRVRVVAVLRRCQHVALVGQRVVRHRRGLRARNGGPVGGRQLPRRRRTPSLDRCRRRRAWPRRPRASASRRERRCGGPGAGRGLRSLVRPGLSTQGLQVADNFAMRRQASCASRYASASSAAMQPVPADVTAWR